MTQQINNNALQQTGNSALLMDGSQQSRSISSSVATTKSAGNASTNIGSSNKSRRISTHRNTNTPYRDNASRILPLTIDTNLPSERCEIQVRQVATTLCPSLLPCYKENSEGDSGSNCSDDEHDPSGTSSTGEKNGFNGTSNNSVLMRQLNVRSLMGGLSNELFVVEVKKNRDCVGDDKDDDENVDQEEVPTTSSVLVRIHPALSNKEFEIVDREAENRLVAWLSSRSDRIAPIFYGRFVNGRVEEFYDNHSPLSHTDMPKYGSEIAGLLSSLHNQKQVPESVLPVHNVKSGGDIWVRIQQWLNMARLAMEEERGGDNGSSDSAAAADDDDDASNNRRLLLSEIQQEFKWLQSALLKEDGSVLDCDAEKDGIGDDGDDASLSSVRSAARGFGRQVVLAHMDAQSLNLLRPNDNSDDGQSSNRVHPLRLIDYEYAGWNPRAIDIANTFLEYCDMNNLKAKYNKEYPSNDVQDEFLRSYYMDCADDGNINSIILERLKHDPMAETAFLSELRDLVGKYTLVSHLGWSAWSIVQDHVSQIEYDYIKYANHRMEGYRYFKQKYWGV